MRQCGAGIKVIPFDDRSQHQRTCSIANCHSSVPSALQVHRRFGPGRSRLPWRHSLLRHQELHTSQFYPGKGVDRSPASAGNSPGQQPKQGISSTGCSLFTPSLPFDWRTQKRISIRNLLARDGRLRLYAKGRGGGGRSGCDLLSRVSGGTATAGLPETTSTFCLPPPPPLPRLARLEPDVAGPNLHAIFLPASYPL